MGPLSRFRRYLPPRWTQGTGTFPRHRLASLIDNLPDVIWTADERGKAVYVSPRIQEVFGFSPRDVYAGGEKLWLDRIHPDDRDGVWQAYERLFAQDELFDVTYRYQHRLGHWIWIHDRALATYASRGRRYCDGVLNDISALKRAQLAELQMAERLRHAQRLESLGQLSAGIAHEFNNLLTVVLGHAELIGHESDQPHVRESASQIRNAGDRGASLVRQILAFGRRDMERKATTDISGVLRETCALLQRLVGDDVAVCVDQEDAPLPVAVDPHQIEHVLTSLLLNARDAMPNGGTITVSVGTASLNDDSLIAPPASKAARYLRLEVCDTGEGMTPETRRRACEPFFTTKEITCHPGLGLSTVYGIVTEHGGAMSIRSAPGAGTRVALYLPA